MSTATTKFMAALAGFSVKRPTDKASGCAVSFEGDDPDVGVEGVAKQVLTPQPGKLILKLANGGSEPRTMKLTRFSVTRNLTKRKLALKADLETSFGSELVKWLDDKISEEFSLQFEPAQKQMEYADNVIGNAVEGIKDVVKKLKTSVEVGMASAKKPPAKKKRK